MSKNYAFKATKRDGAGKGIARGLRREGSIPAVIYGDKKEPLTISIPSNDVNVEYLKGQMYTTLCDMDVDGENHLVLARDVQVHPVTDVVIHVDFLRVTEKTKIPVYVPVKFVNEDSCPGLRAGGVMEVVRYEVELYCSAMAIPESIEVDVGEKDVGDAIKISDAALPEGVKPVIDDRDFAIASIAMPKVVVDDEPSADAEGEEGEEGAEGGEDAAEGAEGGDAPAEGEAKEE